MSNRREFVSLIGSVAAAWPLLARAEQGDRTRRIVVLMAVAESDPDAAPRMAALAQRLQELGWTSGRNIRIDYRWPAPLTAGTGADFERMLSQELVQAKPDAILATGTPMVAALKRATTSVPIVFVQLADPVGSGLVAGLARPGGNITGFANYEYSISGKWLEVLKEAAPRLNKVLFMLNSTNAAWRGFQQSLEQVAASFKLQLTTADINDGADIERAIAAFAREPKGGLIVQPDQVTVVHRQFRTGGGAPPAGGLSVSLLRHQRRPDVVRHRRAQHLPTGGRIHRSHLAGRKGRRSAGAATDEIRAGHQSQGRQGAGPRHCADAARPRRRGDRMTQSN
jgi:putative ABC transport system substrate-binding protein